MKQEKRMRMLAGIMALAMAVSLPVKAAEQPEDAGAEEGICQMAEPDSGQELPAPETTAGADDIPASGNGGEEETPAAEAGQTEGIPAQEAGGTEEIPAAEADHTEETSAPESLEAEGILPADGSDETAVGTQGADDAVRSSGEVDFKKAVTVDPDVWQKSLEYNKTLCSADGMKQAAEGLLRDGDTPLTEGEHYTAVYKNNKKTGTAKVTFTGLGQYTGSFTKSFKIRPDTTLAVTPPPAEVVYVKGGVAPALEVRDRDNVLLEAGKEYTVKYTNHKKCGAASYKVTGKGNFSKAVFKGTFTVKQADLETDCRIEAGNKVYKNKKNAYKSVPVLYDSRNDKKLQAGVDYAKSLRYQIRQGETYRDLEPGEIPDVGSTIRVTVTGTKNYAGTASAEYRITGENNRTISSVTVTPGHLVMASGDTVQLAVSVQPAEETGWTAVFESEDPSVASVEENGVVKAVSKGTATVTAVVTDENGNEIQGSCSVFVDQKIKVLEATPDDGINDTDEFNDAIRQVSSLNEGVSEEDRTILWVPGGVYHINVDDEYKKIEVKSNVTIVMADDAVLQALPTSRSEYYMVWIAGAQNVKFSGGKIIGDRKIHKGTGGADGHCMAVLESQNVVIDGVDVSGGWGDGIYVGIYSGNYGNPERYVKDVYITNCNVHNNRRNNIAVTNGDKIHISHCTLKDHGSNEGLCIETNKNSVPVTNVQVTDCEIAGSVKEAMGIPRPAKNVTFKKCTFKGTAYNGGCGGLVFDSCTITGDLIEANHSKSSLYEHAKLINTTVKGEHIKY